VLGQETAAGVADVADIDRTAELLLWVFQSLFQGKSQQIPSASQPLEALGATSSEPTTSFEVATFGSGCFWCLDAVFRRLQGVVKVECGYAGGHDPNPTYTKVCSGKTGHAEVVQVTFNPDVISFDNLLQVYMAVSDPSGPHVSCEAVQPQYRPIILYHSEVQKEAASAEEDWPGRRWRQL